MLTNDDYYVDNKDYLKPLLDYIVSTWIIKKGRRGCSKAPMFFIELWNSYEIVLYELPTNNNRIEGWQNSFFSKLNCSHASMWKFLKAI